MTHRPLVVIAVFFTMGVFTDYLVYVPFNFIFPVSLIFILFCIFLFISYSFQKNVQSTITSVIQNKFYWKWIVYQARNGVFVLLLLIFLTGISYHNLRFSKNTGAGNNISDYISDEKISIRLRGMVISPPVNNSLSYSKFTSAKHRVEKNTFMLRTEMIEGTFESFKGEKSSREWRKITGVVNINAYSDQRVESNLKEKSYSLPGELKYGDRIELICNISTPSTSRNSGQFDFKQYLKKQKPRIDAVASVGNMNTIKILSKGHGNCFFTFVYGLKNKLNTVLEKNLKKKNIPLISSILLGNRENIPVTLMDSFLKTGTIHFLAISGLHVGILVIFLHYLLKLFRLNTKCSALTIIIIVFLYAVITGMKPPIIRAGIMVATYYGAFIINRRWDFPNSIAAAAFFILLINPSNLFNVGFQLSILALLGIVCMSNRFETFFWKSTLLVERLQAKEERNEIWYLVKIYLRKSFCVSLGAWIAVMPLIAYYFNIITPLNVFLNVILFPLVWIILVGGFILLIFGLLFPVPVTPIAWIISNTGTALEYLVQLFSTNGKTFFYTSTPLILWIVIYYLTTILFIQRERFKIRVSHMVISTLILVNSYIFSGISGSSLDGFKLTCFDVRHGASFFIQFPNGKNMLYDSGTMSNYDIGKFVVAPYLWKQGIKKIDSVVISHEHDDHCNGIASIIERFKVDTVFVNKFFLQSGNRTELLRIISERNIKTELLAKGIEIKGYEPAKIMVLNPPDKDTLRDADLPIECISVNDSSSVLLFDYLDYKLLLCADIGEKGIEMLLSGNDNNIDTDIIQVPHHGGFIVNTNDLLKNTKPEHAIISGTLKDISASTIADYQKYGVSLHKTYESGAISYTINEEGITVSEFL